MTTKTHEPMNLQDFLEAQVYPTLFDRLDAAFPEFGWTRTSRGWTATNRDHTKAVAGARPDRVVCNQPWGFLVHGGDVTTWLSYVNRGVAPRGRDFVEAVRELARHAGVDASILDRPRTAEQQAEDEARIRKVDILETFLEQARHALHGDAGEDARRYLVEVRGFRHEDLEELPFGLFTNQADVKDKLVAAGFTEEEVNESKLDLDSRWYKRLVGPGRNEHGRLVTIWARDLTGTSEESQKYLYLKDGKKPVVFGLDVALRHDAGGRKHLVLVEGVMDVVALQYRGFLNVAGIGGSGGQLTTERWQRLSGLGITSVTLALDNDQAGREGTLTALDHAAKSKLVVFVVEPADLGDAKDPDELVRLHGMEAFSAILDKRRSGTVFRGESLLVGISPDSPDHAKRETVETVAKHLASIPKGPWSAADALTIMTTTAERTGWPAEVLEDVYREEEAREKRESYNREVNTLIADADAARRAGQDSGEVARDLQDGLNRLRVTQAVVLPPAFSVDRLLEETRQTPEGRQSGWATLDELGVFFNPGELAIVGARTGHCKTTLLVGLLLNWLEEERDELLVFYSCEEQEVRIFHRLVSAVSAARGEGWTTAEIRDYLRSPYSRSDTYRWPGTLEDLQAVCDLTRRYEDRLLVVHKPAWTVDEMTDHARSLAQDRKLGAVVVDYLQRIPPPAGRFDRRDVEVSAIGRRLKTLAEDVSAPVIAAAQINRDSIPKDYRTKLNGKSYEAALKEIQKARPDLHHLREGGSEQEADLVLGLLNYAADYRSESEETRNIPDATKFEVGVLKNRYGAVGRWAELTLEARFGLLLNEPAGTTRPTSAPRRRTRKT